jgi:arylsulfatase A-like enzyme
MDIEFEKSRPNLVFILADDLRWNTLGCMGNTIVQTPHIDQLAREGMRFTNAFVTTSICVASRASILTGQWACRHQIEDFAKPFTPAQWSQTYPALLREAGYRTGFVGKFGVGDAKSIAAMATHFDFWRGVPGQGSIQYRENGVHQTARMGNEALEFLASHTGRNTQPFCLSLSFTAPHARDNQPREFEPDPRDESLYADLTIPLPKLAHTDEAFHRLPEAVQKSEGRTRWGWRFDTPEKSQRTLRDYYRLVTGIDREVGRILDKLPANTYVIFLSDNGWAMGERGLADKWFAYEEDIRVPLIVRGPGVKTGTSDAFALNTDIAPTLLSLAGVPLSTSMQGKNLVPILTSRKTPREWRREFFYEHHSVPDRIPPCEAVRTERWKYIRWTGAGDAEELYDLKSDPLEEHNLVANPKHAKVLADLRAKWEDYRGTLALKESTPAL